MWVCGCVGLRANGKSLEFSPSLYIIFVCELLYR